MNFTFVHESRGVYPVVLCNEFERNSVGASKLGHTPKQASVE